MRAARAERNGHCYCNNSSVTVIPALYEMMLPKMRMKRQFFHKKLSNQKWCVFKVTEYIKKKNQQLYFGQKEMLFYRPICIFYPVFCQNLMTYKSTPNLVMKNSTTCTHRLNSMKIWVIWPWQCPPIFSKSTKRLNS